MRRFSSNTVTSGIVSKNYLSKVMRPRSLLFRRQSSKEVMECPIEALTLPIPLWVIRNSHPWEHELVYLFPTPRQLNVTMEYTTLQQQSAPLSEPEAPASICYRPEFAVILLAKTPQVIKNKQGFIYRGKAACSKASFNVLNPLKDVFIKLPIKSGAPSFPWEKDNALRYTRANSRVRRRGIAPATMSLCISSGISLLL
ncbi:unnamed protein product [Merluccius merluccius]